MMRWTAELSPGDVKEVGWQILNEKSSRFSRRCHHNRRYESNVEIFTLALQIATRHFVKFQISTAMSAMATVPVSFGTQQAETSTFYGSFSDEARCVRKGTVVRTTGDSGPKACTVSCLLPLQTQWMDRDISIDCVFLSKSGHAQVKTIYPSRPSRGSFMPPSPPPPAPRARSRPRNDVASTIISRRNDPLPPLAQPKGFSLYHGIS